MIRGGRREDRYVLSYMHMSNLAYTECSLVDPYFLALNLTLTAIDAAPSL